MTRYWRERKKRLQYAWDTSGIFGVLCWQCSVAPFHLFARAHARRKREREWTREREIDLHPLAPSRFLIQPPLPPQSLPSREVERPFEICRWPKNAPEEECALAWPRIQDSYLLTESLRKGGVIERHYYFVRTSSAATARLWTVYASGSLGIYLRQNFFFSQLFSCSPSPSFSLFFSLIHYNFKIYIRLLCVQVFKKLVILSARIGFFYERINLPTVFSSLYITVEISIFAKLFN